MAKRHDKEVILASWSVDAPTWQAFVRALKFHAAQPERHAPCLLKFKEQPTSPARTEVVIRDDAVFVGPHAADIPWAPKVTLQADWLEFYFEPSDDGWFMIPVPVSPAARGDVSRVIEHFERREAESVRINAEAQRLAAEERARPTLNNKLLNIFERHFAWVVLAIFFIVLPAVVGLIVLAQSWLGTPEP